MRLGKLAVEWWRGTLGKVVEGSEAGKGEGEGEGNSGVMWGVAPLEIMT
jgi:hypothetical protein